VKGPGKLAKCRMAKETIIGAKADIVYMCETKFKAPTPYLFSALGPHSIYKWKLRVGCLSGTIPRYTHWRKNGRGSYLSRSFLRGEKINFHKLLLQCMALIEDR